MKCYYCKTEAKMIAKYIEELATDKQLYIRIVYQCQNKVCGKQFEFEGYVPRLIK